MNIKKRKEDYVFFWKCPKVQPNYIGKYIFSQWFTLNNMFKEGEQFFSSTEQYMMFHKAVLFDDVNIAAEIMKLNNPRKIKALGRKVMNYKESEWDKIRYDVVVNGNYLKFSQNEILKDYLLSTGDKTIVEASPDDDIWGIGLKENHPNALHIEKWKGKNLLGYALMEVRDKLKEE